MYGGCAWSGQSHPTQTKLRSFKKKKTMEKQNKKCKNQNTMGVFINKHMVFAFFFLRKTYVIQTHAKIFGFVACVC